MNNKCCEFAHYYFGAAFRFTWPDGDFIEDKFKMFNDGFICGYHKDQKDEENWYEVHDFRQDGDFQLILRDHSDMSKEELTAYKSLCKKITDLGKSNNIIRYADTPLSMDYLFKNNIDAFDLIEDGFAIEIVCNQKRQHLLP
jgi:hypothetical protein